MGSIIERNRSIVPACDFDTETFVKVLEGTYHIDEIGGYKIGPALTGRPGYDNIVNIARAHTDKPLIFDAQKWGTDIPDTAGKLLTPLRDSGFDAVILFPESGPITQYVWTKTAQNLGLGIIVGGEMTHPGYREGDKIVDNENDWNEIFRKELRMELPTGFIRRHAPDDIYEIAVRMGVTNFVVPGNNPESIKRIRNIIESDSIGGLVNPSYFSPGLVAQGGNISEGGKAAGDRFHAIVGRGIYKEGNPRENAINLASQL